MTRRQFETMYRLHINRLLKIAWHLTGSKSEAEDAVQETFLRALRSSDTYDERGISGAWLAKVLINIIRETGRRQTLLRNKIHPELVESVPCFQIIWMMRSGSSRNPHSAYISVNVQLAGRNSIDLELCSNRYCCPVRHRLRSYSVESFARPDRRGSSGDSGCLQ